LIHWRTIDFRTLETGETSFQDFAAARLTERFYRLRGFG
jgi:hypothetical protein